MACGHRVLQSRAIRLKAKLHEKIGSGADFLKRSNHSGWRFE
ncbi:hypothetical protein BRUCa_2076 [Brucella melitensis]|nr:hypothetical protein BM28_A2082 [Brucella melitensis M28]AEW14178.1 hypothetical protein BCA52141_I1849 [Brucella canis HSK A52141]AEW16762.1 hypothetical protein BAA13334_I00635 [Brucella abortus A13334]AIB18599.1 Hypothetical protein BSSP3_I1900 [Brucella suis bv. 2]AIB21984.1 Hypothetical protein BSPT1_I1911 [Brucella suis bv. 2]